MTPMRALLFPRAVLVAPALALLVFGFAAAGAPAPRSPIDLGDLDGVWEGALTNIEGPGLSPMPAEAGPLPPMRIVIRDQRARVYFITEGDATEVKPGAFQIARHGPNAVIYAIDSDGGAPVGESWVESWAISVTLINPEAIAVTYVRVVNNVPIPATEDESKFSMVWSGEMARTE